MLPMIPRAWFSMHGPLKVAPLSGGDETAGLCGRCRFGERDIEIDMTMQHEAQWVTLWHEAAHIAMIDSGVNHAFTKKQREMICDALASYLTAMMQAGRLSVADVAQEA